MDTLRKKMDRLILIGQISSYFALLILSLRHFFVYPAEGYAVLAFLLMIGFIPSFAYRKLPLRYAPFVLVTNALLIVSLVFAIMQEWALSGTFLLVPVYSLLFRERKVYLAASGSAVTLMVALWYLFLFDNQLMKQQMVMIMDVLTVFLILVFIIYFVVEDLRSHYTAEAKHLQTILALSQSVEAKDPYTQGHSERMAYLAEWIVRRLGKLDPKTVYNCGLIHDVGKLSIPDTILLKTSRLTNEEFETMKAHSVTGARLCTNLDMAEDIIHGVLYHHERWDGKGYPTAKRGEEIPLIGRVLCLADSIDAMCSNRAYRAALDMDYVYEEIRRCQAVQFDPQIARIVLDHWHEIVDYYKRASNSLVLEKAAQ